MLLTIPLRSYVTPLLGAYLADAHYGRYKTIAYSLAITVVGHFILIVSSVPGVIDKPSAVGAFIVAIILMGLGRFSLQVVEHS